MNDFAMGTEVRDADGNVTGYLLTPDEYIRALYDRAKLMPLTFDIEQARAEAKAGLGIPHEQIMTMLRGWKDNPPERRE